MNDISSNLEKEVNAKWNGETTCSHEGKKIPSRKSENIFRKTDMALHLRYLSKLNTRADIMENGIHQCISYSWQKLQLGTTFKKDSFNNYFKEKH